MTDEILAALEESHRTTYRAVQNMAIAIDNILQCIAAIDENQKRLARAIESLHNRLLLQEAGTAVYEISQDRSLN